MKGCRSCRNFLMLEEFLDRIDPATQGRKAQMGTCQRYAPHPAVLETTGAEHQVESRWPRVASDNWCGEWDPAFE
jgi:hypothetical protein